MKRPHYDDPRWPWRHAAAASRLPPDPQELEDDERAAPRRAFALEPPKSFAHDLGISVMWAAIWAVLATGNVALASAGLGYTRGGGRYLADADLATSMVILTSAAWAYGFGQLAGRILAHQGGHLASLVAVGVIASTSVATLVMMTWPWLMDASVPTGSVFRGIGRTVPDTLLVLLLLTGTSAWLVALFLPLAAWSLAFPLLLGTIGRLPVYVLGVVAGAVPVVLTLEGPVDSFEGAALTSWAVSGVAVAALVGSVMSRPGAVPVPPPGYRTWWSRRRYR